MQKKRKQKRNTIKWMQNIANSGFGNWRIMSCGARRIMSCRKAGAQDALCLARAPGRKTHNVLQGPLRTTLLSQANYNISWYRKDREVQVSHEHREVQVSHCLHTPPDPCTQKMTNDCRWTTSLRICKSVTYVFPKMEAFWELWPIPIWLN